jgi:hypothetical protein
MIAGALVTGALLLLSREEGGGEAPTRYTERELLMPGNRFLFPDVEQELTTPSIRLTVDPEEPLDRRLVESLLMDPIQSIRQEWYPAAEQELERLLFE